MKFHENEKTIETNIEESNSFTIQSTAKTFKILSNTLYSDKISAVIRELSTNAHDANVEAGSNKAFKVHLPDDIEPWFSVRDYGNGMSHDYVLYLYSSYFSSDKTDRNDVTGAFGLGSKSPFSYVDSFTVTSIHQGVKRSYLAFVDDTGIPKISFLTQENTDEDSGVEVQVPVKPIDFFDFQEKAGSIYYYFDKKPIITNGRLIDRISCSVLYSGKDWKIVGNSKDGETVAVQGNVHYPIKISSIENRDNENFVHNNFILYFDIGELDVAPSREHLSYDSQTIEAIRRKLKKVEGELKKKVQEEINSKKNRREAIKHMFTVKRMVGFSEKNQVFTYNGEQLPKNPYVNIDNIQIKGIDEAIVLEGRERIFKCSLKKKFSYFSSIYILDDSYVFIVNDDDERLVKIKNYLKESMGKLDLKKAYVFPSDFDIKAFSKIFADHSYIYSSSIKNSTPKKIASVEHYYEIKSYEVLKKDKKLVVEEPTLWVKINRGKLVLFGEKGFSNFYMFREFMENNISEKMPIVGISKTAMSSKIFKNNKNLISFEDFFKEKFDEYISKNKDKIVRYNSVDLKRSFIRKNFNEKIIEIIKKNEFEDELVNDLKHEIDDIEKTKFRHSQYENIIMLADFFNIKIGVEHSNLDRFLEFFEKFPLIKHLNFYSLDKNLEKNIVDYMRKM